MWKECIKGYEISSTGVVRNINTKRVLKEERNGTGYRRITIKKKHYSLHRLVALTFIPNPKGLPDVIFKDSDKEYISLTNLEWSVKQNDRPLPNTRQELKGNNKLTPNMIKGIIINKKVSAKEYSRILNVSVSTIYAVRAGRNMKRINTSTEQ